MPQVNFKYILPDGSPATGSVHATPTRRHYRGDQVVLPDPLVIEVDNGSAEAVLAPTGEGWVWQVREFMDLPHPATVYVTVPDSGDPVDFTDLPVVDPATLEPGATPVARWWAELEANNATAGDMQALAEQVETFHSETEGFRDESLQALQGTYSELEITDGNLAATRRDGETTVL